MTETLVDLPPDDRALEALLRERRLGPPMPDEVTPWDFVHRWPPAAVRDRVWPVVERLLTDDDELVRLRAVEFVRGWSDGVDVTTPRLFAIAEQHGDRFGATLVEGLPLGDALAHALTNRVDASNGPRVAAILRTMARTRPVGGGAAGVLGRYEPAFVAAQAQAWGDAQLDWIADAASSMSLFRRDAIVPFLQAVRSLGEDARDRLLFVVEDNIQRDDSTAAAFAKTRGLPPPTQPAPSEAECRQAIGL